MKNKYVDGFRDRLLKAIENKKMSIRQVGVLTGISSNSMNCYINEGQMPSCVNLVKLAKLLKVSTDWLLGLEE